MMTHHELSINEDVAAKNESCDGSIDELSRGAVGEEHGHEAEEDKTPESAEKIRHPGSEIILGLAGKSSKEDENTSSKYNGIEDDFGLVEGYDDGDGVSFGKGKERQEEEICRVGLSLPVRETHENHGSNKLFVLY